MRVRIRFAATVPGAALYLLIAATLPGGSAAETPRFGGVSPVNQAAADADSEDANPRVAASSAGAWVVVWESTAPQAGGRELGRDSDLLYARSTDGGVSWSEAAALSARVETDDAGDREPALATDGAQNWIIAWASEDDMDDVLRRDRDILVVRSTDGGLTWSAPAALNSNAADDWGGDERPSLATDGKGTWVAVWQSADSFQNTIGGDRDLAFAVSRDVGASWSVPRPLNSNAARDAGFDVEPHVAAGGDDVWITVWSSDDPLGRDRRDDRDVLFARSTDGARSWTKPAMLASNGLRDSRPDWKPRIVTDGKGRWLCAWSSADTLSGRLGMDRDLLAVRSSDGGLTWSDPAPLNSNASRDAGDDYSVELAVDGRGVWLAVWQSWDSMSGTVGRDADIFVARSNDAGKSWSEPMLLDVKAASDKGADGVPHVATDGNGGWVAVWQSTEPRGGELGVDPDIFSISAQPGAVENGQ